MKLQISKLKLVDEHRTNDKGEPLFHIALSHVKVLDDTGKYVRFAKHTQPLLDILEAALKDITIDVPKS